MAAAIYKGRPSKRVPSPRNKAPQPNPALRVAALHSAAEPAAERPPAGHGARPELVVAPRPGAHHRGHRRRRRDRVGGDQGARRRQLDGGAARGRDDEASPAAARVALPAPDVRERPRPYAADGVRTYTLAVDASSVLATSIYNNIPAAAAPLPPPGHLLFFFFFFFPGSFFCPRHRHVVAS